MKKVIQKLADAINYIESYLVHKRHKRNVNLNAYNILWQRAAQESADFISPFLNDAMLFKSSEEMWSYAAQLLLDKKNGIVLEFGVASGHSINYLSSRALGHKFYGFDSFEGLPEAWVGHHALKGGYSQNGNMPKVNKNVELVKGWFDQTLEPFVERVEISKNLRLIHIDSDIYSAAKTIFMTLSPYISTGVYILFDEYHGYPNWRNGEFKAFKEFVVEHNISFKYKAFSKDQCLVEIT